MEELLGKQCILSCFLKLKIGLESIIKEAIVKVFIQVSKEETNH